jgi:hypothetical protein
MDGNQRERIRQRINLARRAQISRTPGATASVLADGLGPPVPGSSAPTRRRRNEAEAKRRAERFALWGYDLNVRERLLAHPFRSTSQYGEARRPGRGPTKDGAYDPRRWEDFERGFRHWNPLKPRRDVGHDKRIAKGHAEVALARAEADEAVAYLSITTADAEADSAVTDAAASMAAHHFEVEIEARGFTAIWLFPAYKAPRRERHPAPVATDLEVDGIGRFAEAWMKACDLDYDAPQPPPSSFPYYGTVERDPYSGHDRLAPPRATYKLWNGPRPKGGQYIDGVTLPMDTTSGRTRRDGKPTDDTPSRGGWVAMAEGGDVLDLLLEEEEAIDRILREAFPVLYPDPDAASKLTAYLTGLNRLRDDRAIAFLQRHRFRLCAAPDCLNELTAWSHANQARFCSRRCQQRTLMRARRAAVVSVSPS